MQKGFTLAEVLITLGIIGIVAAMTMPVINAKTQDLVLDSQYKKSQNILSNGYKLMMAKSSTYQVENLPFLSACTDNKCISMEHKNIFSIINDSAGNLSYDILPQEYSIKGKSEKSNFKWIDTKYIFATNDGMIFGLTLDDEASSFSIVSDVNGIKMPNVVKRDLYKFRYSGAGKLSDVSDELEDISVCTIENPTGCTEQQCMAILGYHQVADGQICIEWFHNKCQFCTPK